MDDRTLRRKLQLGGWVMLGLLTLDGIEFAIGSQMKRGALIPLIVLALVSTWLIARFYMHIRQLRRRGEA